MLQTKFQGHRSIGPGGEDFFKAFNIYGYVTLLIVKNFIPIHP